MVVDVVFISNQTNSHIQFPCLDHGDGVEDRWLVEPRRDKAVKFGGGVNRFQREGEQMNRQIDLTSVSVSVLIFGKKGLDLEREIEIFGENKEADVEILSA